MARSALAPICSVPAIVTSTRALSTCGARRNISTEFLGAISGGAIILFADYLVSQDDTFTHIGTTALGFVAGYSTDFLFNTVERIVTALFPKVDVQTVSQGPPPKRLPKPDADQDKNKNGKGGASGSGDTTNRTG
jgi:hypothetical protein